VADWVAAYERAWRTPGTDALAELFAPDAVYSQAPYAELRRGLAEIADMWEGERAGPDEPFAMTHEVVAAEGGTGVVRVAVRYDDPPAEYRDLWVVRLDGDGRCTHFEEWPFAPPAGAPPGTRREGDG
jgi:ketosteroid isomerase-like protein